ncbi:MAG: imelysin family protein [Gammaproteobacteria bacterium]|nr:imelysin family protein [Gammaproteobacteria bacterium]
MFKYTVRSIMLALLAGYAQAYDFRAIADDHVVPAYRNLASHTGELDGVASGYCGAPSSAAMQPLRQVFRDAFLAWQGAQHLRFGPVQFLSREHRFALWPDKRGTVSKHLRRLLEDPALQAADFDISQKSVAVQGFSALEQLLFDDVPPDANTCRVITAIAANLHVMADGLVNDWTAGDEAYLRYFTEPGPGNLIFDSDAALAGQLLNSLHTELELIETQKLARPLGDDISRARGQRAEGWRSGSSLTAIASNLAACDALYRHAFATELEGQPLQQKINAAFAQVRSTLDAVQMPLAEAVSDPAQRALLVRLQQELSTLRQLVAADLAGTLGLSLGFNSLDGD